MIEPVAFNEGYLEELDGHRVYFAQFGNRDGEAIVYLHGGPGSKSKAKYLRNFDLETYHVIFFDQRGCGKSTPLGSIAQNTIHTLMDDMERLRERVSVESWFISGGSWGSTLALAYAEKFPMRVRGLLLSAIFLADSFSTDWSFSKSDGVANFFTDVWDERLSKLQNYNADEKNSSHVLLKLLLSSDIQVKREVTAVVSNWEGNLLGSSTDVMYMTAKDVSDEDIASAIVFLHYESNNFFLAENQLLENISKISEIPMVIVHGRHDVLCPFKGAWDLHKAHEKSKLVSLPQSNHRFSADGEVAKKYIFESFLRSVK